MALWENPASEFQSGSSDNATYAIALPAWLIWVLTKLETKRGGRRFLFLFFFLISFGFLVLFLALMIPHLCF
jgi:hypothetical protein